MLFLLVIVFGLIIGSFLNVLIYRLPREEGVTGLVWDEKIGRASTERQFRHEMREERQGKWDAIAAKQYRHRDDSRSKCPHCQHQINWYDLIPVASFFILKRRCRHCHGSISWRYPLVELITAFLFAGWVWLNPVLLFNPWSALGALIIIAGLLAILLIDFKHFVIPDKILIVLAALGVFLHLVVIQPFLYSALIAGAIFGLIWYLGRGQWMGLGDVKLVAVLGLLVGYPGIVYIIYGGLLLGVVWGLVLLATHRATLKSRLPFGSLLALVALLYFYTGSYWPNWLGRQLELVHYIFR